MSRDRDEALMAMAIEAAHLGRPSPNPHVGAVLATRDGQVVAVGHHARAGLDHAEVDAIKKVPSAEGLTLYVTMEPCNHYGRTPPCTEAIVAAKVARVVVGCADPKPHVAGSADRLRGAGIEVTLGVLEKNCAALIADFEKHITTGRPFVTLKAALTLDGRIATATGDSRWITGEAARAEAHRLRDRNDAVLVGVGTVLADDPELTVRLVDGVDPLRVVLDGSLRTPPSAKLARRGTLIFAGEDASPAAREALEARGVEVAFVPRRGAGLDLEAVLATLGQREVVRLLVEGGAKVHDAFLAGGHADQVAAFVAPRLLADRQAPGFGGLAGAQTTRIADAWALADVEVRPLGSDVLFFGRLRRGVDPRGEQR